MTEHPASSPSSGAPVSGAPASLPSDDLEVGPLLLRIVLFIRRYGRKLVVGSLAGLLIGGFIYWLLPRTYQAQMVLQSTVISNVQGLHVVTSWTKLLNKSGYPVLAKMFDMPLEDAKQLVDMTAGLITGNDDQSGGIVIGIEIKDTALLPAFQKGILHALQTNDYIQQRVEIRRQNLEVLLAQAKQELQKLDSVKPYLRNFSESEQAPNGKFIVDLSNISNQRLACQDRISAFEERLHFNEAVYVLQGLIRSKTGKIVPAPTLPLLGLIIGFLISYTSVMYAIFRRKYLAVVKTETLS